MVLFLRYVNIEMVSFSSVVRFVIYPFKKYCRSFSPLVQYITDSD